MANKGNPVNLSIVLAIVKLIYGHLRSWLLEEAKKTETPVDDWMLGVLDKLLLD